MHRNGFASLLALVTLAVATTVVAGMLTAARSTTLAGMAAEQQCTTDTLLADGEQFACTWLDQHGSHVVLPPAGGGILLLDHTWSDHAGRPCRLAILAWDALAALPPAALVAGHPLRLGLAAPGSAPTLHVPPGTIPPRDLLGSVPLPSSWERVPTSIPANRPVGSTIDALALAPRPLLALWFSPDNPGAINANTAPAAILRAAAGATDVEAILAQRRSGQRWEGPSRAGAGDVQIVPGSNRWNLLLTATSGSQTQARWAVGDGVAGRTRIIRRADVTPAPATAPDP